MVDFLLKDQVSSCAALRTRESICQQPQQSPAGLLAFAFRPAGLVLSELPSLWDSIGYLLVWFAICMPTAFIKVDKRVIKFRNEKKAPKNADFAIG